MNPTFALIFAIILLAINAFFVAGEFATTSTRRAQIEPLVAQKKAGAAQALYAIEHVSLMLAICQLGITVASTSLGVVAEPAIAHLIEEPLVHLGLPAASSHIIGFTVALAIVLYAHVVLGEMVPKNISIASPQKTLLILAPPLVAIGHILRPIITLMDGIANWFLRLAKIEPQSEVGAAFTVEEVASIVELSAQEGKLDDELGLLSGTLEFSTEDALSTMVPLADLVVLPEDVTPAQVEREVAVTGFSRFPVVAPDGRLSGYIHLKDVLYATEDNRDTPIASWRIRRMDSVQANDEVEDVLRHMQRIGTHCVEVIDSEGDVVGVLFLEDIIEQLVGEVRDSLQRDQGI
ncbi:MAG: hemolysin family protein [Actinomycetaceae bacterium]|nr:hemolysin family protein [Actinomycetaceae bacterium]